MDGRSMIDREALVAELRRRATNAPSGDAPFLVQYAIYTGLADQVARGDFDMEEKNDAHQVHPAPDAQPEKV